MGLIDIIMGSIIFIFIGGVIVYLLVFSMKSKRTKLLMAMIILFIIGYLSAVVMTAYQQQYVYHGLSDETVKIYRKKCIGEKYFLTDSEFKKDLWSAFLLKNYFYIVLKSKVLNDSDCFTSILRAFYLSKHEYEYDRYIYIVDADKVIYEIKPMSRVLIRSN